MNFETEAYGTSVVTYDTGGYSEGLTSGCDEAVDRLKGALDLVKKLAMEGRPFRVDTSFEKLGGELFGRRAA